MRYYMKIIFWFIIGLVRKLMMPAVSVLTGRLLRKTLQLLEDITVNILLTE